MSITDVVLTLICFITLERADSSLLSSLVVSSSTTTTADGLGYREQLAPTADESAAVPRAVVGAAGSLEVDARVANAAPESATGKLMVPEEQTMLPESSGGMVGHVVRPPSPQVVPPAMEEDDVEEIEREESRP